MKSLSSFFIALFFLCCLGCSDCDPLSDTGNEVVVQFFVDRGNGFEPYSDVPFEAVRGEFWSREKSFEFVIGSIDTTLVGGEEIYDTTFLEVPVAGFVPLDTLFSSISDSSSVILLPLSFQRDSSIFSFSWNNEEGEIETDTLRIYHSHNILVNSPDCGFIDEFALSNRTTLGVFYNHFDSVSITDPTIKLDPSIVNIEVYLSDTLSVFTDEGE